EGRVRNRAKLELDTRDTDQVVAAVRRWLAGLDAGDPQYEHHRMEALWVHQHHNAVDVDLLGQSLRSPDFHARAAAVRVLCSWRDRVPDALERLKALAADPYPRVRLEAVRAASFFPVAEAVEVPLISADHPSDVYLDYTRGETMRALEPYWKQAVADGRPIAVTSVAGARFFLRNLSTAEILKMKRTRAIDLELLFRKGVRDEDRRAALADLARLDGQGEVRVLLDAIGGQDDQKGAQDEGVVFDLARLLTGRPAAELTGVRADLQRMALGANLPVTRQLAFVALIAADDGVDRAWELGTRSVPALQDLLNAMPLIRDPNLRAALYPKAVPLLSGLPGPLASSTPQAKGTSGRFVRVELPGRKTLTLAEVEVYSDGRNVARRGKATQKNTSHGGDARRAIDGNTDGSYGGGGQTHSEENTRDPWWEVDLGSEVPIDKIVLYNRTEGDLGKRLDGFTLKVLDDRRNVVYQKAALPAPGVKAAYELGGGGSEGIIRRAAINALTYVRGQETPTFGALARLVREGVDRPAAIRALRRIPATYWPQEEVRPLLESLIAAVRGIPVADRTSEAALDALQLGEALAARLPREQALATRRELGELGVRLLRIGTVPDQMLFDKERLAVAAGRPVEIVFENDDLMPHNFVVTRPGALEPVGLLSEATATEPGALERNYVPPSKDVLLASRLLAPREVQRLDFTAPSRPGVYPYVCTYPGHWRRMYGALYVVADLEDYLADPESYLARNPLPIADELLRFNRPRTQWMFEDLASSVQPLGPGRSFNVGKQMFQVASCVACHRLGGIGEAVGPDLTQLDPKLTPAEILRDMLDPSAKINEKYQTFLFGTEAGRVVTGLVVAETPEQVTVLENPLAKTPPVVLRRGEIVESTKSPTSIMPKGLLDKLTREEILDLLAYVVSRGNPQHEVFGAGHDHAHGAGGH
ncbi:MAG TPA: discoidin domain-containing protein, partial [Isosphaeraceae bacterium]